MIRVSTERDEVVLSQEQENVLRACVEHALEDVESFSGIPDTKPLLTELKEVLAP